MCRSMQNVKIQPDREVVFENHGPIFVTLHDSSKTLYLQTHHQHVFYNIQILTIFLEVLLH